MATTTNYSWSTPDDTALVKDGAAAIRSLGTAIDSTVFTNAGAAIAKTIVDAKGDLIVGTAADTVARLASSASNGDLLTVDTSTASGLKWSAPAAGGKLLQVVNATTTTSTTIASTSYTDTTITATITPTSATSKILILVTGLVQLYRGSASGNQQSLKVQIVKNGSSLKDFGFINTFVAAGTFELNSRQIYSQTYLDSPASTSALTYKIQAAAEVTTSSGSVVWQGSPGNESTIQLLEIGA
jgi:hypothetical protein